MNKQKILFILPSMRGGGSERIISLLIRNLDRSKFQIILLLLKKEGVYLKDIPKDVEVVDLNAPRLRHVLVKLPKTIQQLRPDIVLSTLNHVNIYIAMMRPMFNKNITFIARISSIVSLSNKHSPYPHLFDWMYKHFLNNFDFIVCQSHYMKNDLSTNYGINNERLLVIHNPVDTEHISNITKGKKQLYNSKNINLLAVGRLNNVKGFDLLLQSMVHLDKHFYLTIVGEGNEFETLQQLAVKLDIADRVEFIGFQENPYQYMQQADMMVLSSRHEGFPNVVLEANACGTPVVAFDCPGGTGEIIENGVNGFLVNCGDTEKLAETIQKASKYPWDNEAIKNHIIHRYGLTHIIHQYEDILGANISAK